MYQTITYGLIFKYGIEGGINMSYFGSNKR